MSGTASGIIKPAAMTAAVSFRIRAPTVFPVARTREKRLGSIANQGVDIGMVVAEPELQMRDGKVWRWIKRKLRKAVVPCVFLSLTGYFVWSATQGDRGTAARDSRMRELAAASDQLKAAQDELHGWEHRVAALRGDRLDADLLDERARVMLNVTDPNDVILPYPDGKKLF